MKWFCLVGNQWWGNAAGVETAHHNVCVICTKCAMCSANNTKSVRSAHNNTLIRYSVQEPSWHTLHWWWLPTLVGTAGGWLTVYCVFAYLCACVFVYLCVFVFVYYVFIDLHWLPALGAAGGELTVWCERTLRSGSMSLAHNQSPINVINTQPANHQPNNQKPGQLYFP